ncbi:tyrosine--tRNA ligase [Nakamurella aerolata]|uniref:Tyrosine--tRNA ligase n=1 Tax=Nakamurella aerolata TaxID=1656892 RepID=A0A849A6K8_9ACTN|nr:tyrosine--tRNA ligase [Nakamurella aerolata]NNG36189.1 tyrosine--tRNA ligase [Nakamurella aerolata]
MSTELTDTATAAAPADAPTGEPTATATSAEPAGAQPAGAPESNAPEGNAPKGNAPNGSGVLDELRWRGLIALSTDEQALAEHLAAGPVTVYAGFDPTAPSLHFGHLVQLILLRKLQRAGHHVICLVGGSTGLIGDPKPDAERTLKTKEQTAEWVTGIQQQVRPFLDFAGENPARMVNNLDWTAPLSAIDFLRDIGKYFRVNTMLRKEAVAARMSSDSGINYTEFSYQLLQALDFLHLYREYGCTLQTGGQDQWGNLTAGADLIHRAEGVSVHLLATPLITDAAGRKIGKTEGNAIWLSAELTSPYAFHQYWLTVDDSQVGQLLRVFTDRTPDEIAELEQATLDQPQARRAQHVLADDVTTLVHGADAVDAANKAAAALFGRAEFADLDEATLRAALTEVGLTTAAPDASVAHLLQGAGLVKSLSEARRTVAEGGAYLNNHRLADADAVPDARELLHGRYAVLRRGKRAVAGVEIEHDA